jgi:hypothetical protein
MRLAVVTALACAALALPACGGDEGEPIPRSDERRFLALLDEAERRQNPLRCDDLTVSDDEGPPTLDDLQEQVDGLPDSVDADVRDALRDSVLHLRRLVEDQCAEESKPQTTPTEPPPETTPPEPETQPPPKTETEPPETETQPPETTPEDGGGQPGPDEEGKKKGKEKAKETRG